MRDCFHGSKSSLSEYSIPSDPRLCHLSRSWNDAIHFLILMSSGSVEMGSVVVDSPFVDLERSCAAPREVPIWACVHRFLCRRQSKKAKAEIVRTNTATPIAIPASAPVGRFFEDVGSEDMFEVTGVGAGDDVIPIEDVSPVAELGMRREMALVLLAEGEVLPLGEADEEMATSVGFGPGPAVSD